jgi:Flp pilus assembly protein TadD
MGLVYAQMGHQEQAGKVLQLAVALDPNSESAHGTLALWYEKNRNFAAAAREYRRALELDHNDGFAQMGLLRTSTLQSTGASDGNPGADRQSAVPTSDAAPPPASQ